MAKMRLNRELLPVKAHYFFFFAALGPVLPQLNVYGRQLGVSPEVMGLVTAVLPLLWAAAKPCFGYLVDYFTNLRKFIFMMLILTMSTSYCALWFLPQPEQPPHDPNTILEMVYHSNGSIYLKSIKYTSIVDYNNDLETNLKIESNFDDLDSKNETGILFKSNTTGNEGISNITIKQNNSTAILQRYLCNWECTKIYQFEIYIKDSKDMYLEMIYINDDITNDTCAKYGMELVRIGDGIECTAKNNCNLFCIREVPSNFDNETIDNNVINKTDLITNNTNEGFNLVNESIVMIFDAETRDFKENDTMKSIDMTKDATDLNSTGSIYGTVTFWGFVILMCVGTVAFNVANCISDAICFDVLGLERAGLYGNQRAWGTAGYGATAILGGWLVDLWSYGAWKNFTPAFVLAAIFTVLDLLSCQRLTLPRMTSASEESGGAALRAVLRCPRVLLFIAFAVVAGMFDSFIIYYMFWYIEELAAAAGDTDNVKLLEGVIVFGQSFVGELIFFFLSGRILQRFGHGTTMTFCLLCYGLRLAFVSLVTNPWHLVPVEAVMQGPTYALCYATIVGYAAAVAPEGHSATMQGIVAGMDDGVGFALGSLVGGQLYGYVGGCGAFRVMAGVAVAAAALHALLHRTVLAGADARKAALSPTDLSRPDESERMLHKMAPRVTVMAPLHAAGDAVYCDTVVPLHPDEGRAAVGMNNAR